MIVGGGLWTAQYIWASMDYDDKKSAYENHVAEANAKYAEKVNSLYSAYNAADAKRIEAQGILNNANFAVDNATDIFNSANSKFEDVKKLYVEGSEPYQNAKKNLMLHKQV